MDEMVPSDSRKPTAAEAAAATEEAKGAAVLRATNG
jgi:hypothetical protein